MGGLFHSSFIRAQLLHGVLVPAAVAALVAAFSRAFASAVPGLGRRLARSVVPAAFLAGYFAVYRDFTLPPATVLSWLPWLIAALAVAGSLPDRLRSAPLVQAGRVVASAAAAALLLWPILRREGPLTAIPTWAGVTAAWSFLWVAARSRDVGRLPLAAAALTASVGLALAAPLSGSILLGQLAASLAVALGAAIVLSYVTASAGAIEGAGDTALLVLGTLLVDLRFYAAAGDEVVLGLVASLAAGIAAAIAVSRRGLTGPWPVLVPVLIALIPAGIAAGIALRVSQAGGGAY